MSGRCSVLECAPGQPRTLVELFGLPVDALTMDETVAAVSELVAHGGGYQHVSLNAAKVVAAKEDPRLAAIIRQCDLVNADGMSVVWASRILGRRSPNVWPASTSSSALSQTAERDGRSVYFLGAVARSWREVAASSGCVIQAFASRESGRLLGRRRSGRRRHPECAARLPVPRHSEPAQGVLALRPLDDCGVPFVMGVGGSFDVVAGRSPGERHGWVQRTGLEWSWRLVQEPRRMWRRYLVGNSAFIRSDRAGVVAGDGERAAVIAGARPNFVKVAPLLRAMHAGGIEALLVHTGQHYDWAMSEALFADLGIPEPDVNLDVGSGSHASQTARVMTAFEEWLDEQCRRPGRDGRRRQLDARVHAGRREAVRYPSPTSRRGCVRSTARCRRRSTASSSTRSPRGCSRRRPTRREPARRGRDPRAIHLRRQHHGRQPAGESRPGAVVDDPRGARARRAGTGWSRFIVRRSSTTPTVLRAVVAALDEIGTRLAARLPGPSAYAAATRGERRRRRLAQATPRRSGRVPRLLAARGGGHAGADRLRRASRRRRPCSACRA